MKKLLLILLFSSPLLAQKAEINGTLTDSKNEKILGVSVQLKNTKLGTTTNQDGFFSIQNIPVGEYELIFRSIGFNIKIQKVNLLEGKNEFNFTLSEALTELQTIEVTGRKETDYKNAVSYIGSKSSTFLKDIPQSISYVTKEIMADQGAFRLGDVIKNMSGVNQASGYNDMTIRGSRISGQENYSMLVNGMRTVTSFWKQQLTPHIERVEVIKGPSSALYGNAAAGGSINRVTKKPLDEKRQAVNFQMGSFNTLRATADFTGPLNEDKSLLYRLNIGYENAGSFRDLQKEKNVVIAPSFSFLPNEKTRVNFDLVLQKTNSLLDRGHAVLSTGDLFSVPITKSLSRVNDYLNEDSYSANVSLSHQFSKNITFNTSFMQTQLFEDLLEHRTANTYAKDGAGALIPNLVEMQSFIRKRTWNNANVSNYFNINFNVGKLENRVVVGYDYAQEKLDKGGSQLIASGYRNAANTGSIATYDPTKKAQYLLDSKGSPVPNVAHFNLTEDYPYYLTDMSKYFFTKRDFVQSLYSSQGFYIQDQIKLGKLQAIIGLRQDVFTEFTAYTTSKEKKVVQKALIPRLGLVYSLNKNVNAYATFVKGYQPQVSATIANPNAGGPFDPLYSSLMEGGLKTEWLDKRLTAAVSFYNLKVKGALYNAGVAGQPELLTQIGEEIAKGVEFDIVGQIATNWSILVNYAYNDAKITNSKTASEIGRQKPNAPLHQGNLWTKYTINRGAFGGMGFGFGTNFASQRLGSIVAAGVNPQEIPAYQLVNAAIYYQIQKFKIQVNANNLTDKTHWVGGYDRLRMFPGQPRNFLLGIGYTF